MPTELKCPGCGHSFEPNDAIREEVQRELNIKARDWQKRKDEEFRLKETASAKTTAAGRRRSFAKNRKRKKTLY